MSTPHLSTLPLESVASLAASMPSHDPVAGAFTLLEAVLGAQKIIAESKEPGDILAEALLSTPPQEVAEIALRIAGNDRPAADYVGPAFGLLKEIKVAQLHEQQSPGGWKKGLLFARRWGKAILPSVEPIPFKKGLSMIAPDIKKAVDRLPWLKRWLMARGDSREEAEAKLAQWQRNGIPAGIVFQARMGSFENFREGAVKASATNSANSRWAGKPKPEPTQKPKRRRKARPPVKEMEKMKQMLSTL